MDQTTVLVADDELNIRKVLAALLEKHGYRVITCADGNQVIDVLKTQPVNVVVTDLKMPGQDGMKVLEWTRRNLPRVPVIIITAHGTVDNAVQAVKAGAFDYVTKPYERDELLATIAKAAATERLARRDFRPGPEEAGRFRIIGQTPQMLKIYEIIEKVADTPSTVLITGESGTGKELIAAALHHNSSRRDKPFIRINCAAIPRELVESELFG
ncbi:MAG: sigma-54-dependent Fis family transcriptional regulator, partial [Deltaproteobacteria bacterium]